MIREGLGIGRRTMPDSVERMASRHQKKENKDAEREWGDHVPKLPIPNHEPWCRTVCTDGGNQCKAPPSGGIPSVSSPGCYQVCTPGPFVSSF